MPARDERLGDLRRASASGRCRAPRARRDEPDAELAALLPCLTTGTPDAAATTAAIVEMLTVPKRSPPVPTMSSTSGSTGSGSAASRIASRKPTISSTVSPLARRATRNPASCEGVAAPDMIWRIAHVDSETLRSSSSQKGGEDSRPGVELRHNAEA